MGFYAVLESLLSGKSTSRTFHDARGTIYPQGRGARGQTVVHYGIENVFAKLGLASMPHLLGLGSVNYQLRALRHPEAVGVQIFYGQLCY